MSNKKRPMWQFPWQYKESLLFVLGIVLVGTLLQLSLGSFDFYILHSPYNLIVGAALIALITAMSFFRNNPIISWLSGGSLSVAIIGALLLMTIIMGLTPQFARVDTAPHIHWEHASWGDIVSFALMKLGFKQMTTSWPFVLIYMLCLLTLGLVVAQRLHKFRWQDYGFYLNHLGLWLLLFAAGLGSADILRYVMYVEEGEMEWRVYDSQKNVYPLDIAIQLHDFIMEEYPPNLAIIDKYTGDVQPENNPIYHQINDKNRVATLANWRIDIEEYIHEAVRQSNNSFQAIPMAGSMPAARVKASNMENAEVVEGWVTCGSINQYVLPLELDSIYSLVMTKPEPKRFASDITVITKDDRENIRATLEVNAPLKMGNWMIYQYDYDHKLGKASRFSGFELVYDPWLYAVYAGIFLMASGSVCMLWMGNKKRRK